MKYIKTNWDIPYYNMAFEYYLMNNDSFDDDFVFFYIHKPSIIIGKHQNTVEEINSKFVKDNNIVVARRNTGGGAVYHDKGNLNFSFVFKKRGNEEIDFHKYTLPVIKALEKLGLSATLSGRNDILIDGRKISGNAQYMNKKKVLHHGTLMFDVEIEALVNSLNVSGLKIESKAIKSVRSRVANIKEFLKDKDLDIYKFKEFLLESFFEDDDFSEYKLSEADKKEIEKLVKEKFGTWEHNYGLSPAFSMEKKDKFDAGIVGVSLNIKEGKIEDIKITGDYFFVKGSEELENLLIQKEFKEEAIKEVLKENPIGDYITNLKEEEFISLLF